MHVTDMKKICHSDNDTQMIATTIQQIANTDFKKLAMTNANFDFISKLMNRRTFIFDKTDCFHSNKEQQKNIELLETPSPSSLLYGVATSNKMLGCNTYSNRFKEFSPTRRNKDRNIQQKQLGSSYNANKHHITNYSSNIECKKHCHSKEEYNLKFREDTVEAHKVSTINIAAVSEGFPDNYESEGYKNLRQQEQQRKKQKTAKKQRNNQYAISATTIKGVLPVSPDGGDLYSIIDNTQTSITSGDEVASFFDMATPKTTVAVASIPVRKISHRKNKCSSNEFCVSSTSTDSVAKPLNKSNTINIIERQPSVTRDPKGKNTCTTLAMTTTVPFVLKHFIKFLENTIANISLAKVAEESTKTTNILTSCKIYQGHEQQPLGQKLRLRKANSKPGRRVTAALSCGSSSTRSTRFRLLPSLGATSFFTILTLICLETVLLSTVSNCAKTFYMHWNTSNSIFRIDNTDHIIDVNKGNLAFEFDQVHIICPVYEPGTFENETEKYIIYNVSKVEYETCRITNADPRVIAICDKPQKLMFFTITFRPFTPQPGGLEFLPGNDYYFISTSSKDDLYRRIGGRCSTNNMKVVFKVCCAPEDKSKTTTNAGSNGTGAASSGINSGGTSVNAAINIGDGISVTGGAESSNSDIVNTQTNQHPHLNNINAIGINGVNTGLMPLGGGLNVGVGVNGGNINNGGMQLKPMSGASGTSINTNIDQFNRIPIQTNSINVMGNNMGGLGGIGLGGHGGGGIMLTPGGHGGINMISGGGGIGIGQYPGHPGQTGIRINNVASQHHSTHKNNNINNNGKEVGTGVGVSEGVGDTIMSIGFGDSQFLPPFINTNHSNIVQSTINWPGWGRGGIVTHAKNTNHSHSNQTTTTTSEHIEKNFNNNELNTNYYSPSHRPNFNNKNTNKKEHYDKHPNEVVKNEELTYNSGAASLSSWWPSWKTYRSTTTSVEWFLSYIFFSPVGVPVVDSYGTLLNEIWTQICSGWLTASIDKRIDVCSLMWHNTSQNQQKNIKIGYSGYKVELKQFLYIDVIFSSLIFICIYLAMCSIISLLTSDYCKLIVNVRTLHITHLMPRTATNTGETTKTPKNSETSSIPTVFILNWFGTKITSFSKTFVEFLSAPASLILRFYARDTLKLTSNFSNSMFVETDPQISKVVQVDNSSSSGNNLNLCNGTTSITKVRINKSR